MVITMKNYVFVLVSLIFSVCFMSCVKYEKDKTTEITVCDTQEKSEIAVRDIQEETERLKKTNEWHLSSYQQDYEKISYEIKSLERGSLTKFLVCYGEYDKEKKMLWNKKYVKSYFRANKSCYASFYHKDSESLEGTTVLYMIDEHDGTQYELARNLYSFGISPNGKYLLIHSNAKDKKNRRKNYQVAVYRTEDLFLSERIDLLEKIDYFPPDDISSKFEMKDGMLYFSIIDDWEEVINTFTFDGENCVFKKQRTEYSKTYAPTDVDFEETDFSKYPSQL